MEVMKMENVTKTRKQGNSLTLTVPSDFKIKAGVAVRPELTPEGIFYRFIEKDTFWDFSTEILRDLVAKGTATEDLVSEFEKAQREIPVAIDRAAAAAEQAPVMTKRELAEEIGLSSSGTTDSSEVFKKTKNWYVETKIFGCHL